MNDNSITFAFHIFVFMFGPGTQSNKRYISLQEAADYSKIYSQEYLSLRARQKKLKSIKLGRNWVTTKEWVKEYIQKAKSNGNGNSVSYHTPEVGKANSGIMAEVNTKTDIVYRACPFLFDQPGDADKISDIKNKDLQNALKQEASVVNISSNNLLNNKTFKKNKNLFFEFVAIAVIFGFVISVEFLTAPQNNNFKLQNEDQKNEAWLDSILSPIEKNFSSAFSQAKESSSIVINKTIEIIKRGAEKEKFTDMAFKKISNLFSFLRDKTKSYYLSLSEIIFKSNNLKIKNSSLSLSSNMQTGKIENGVIVMPSLGEEKDKDIKSKIQESFSDEIIVEPADDNSGIIVPVFKDKLGESYLYMMVPTKN